jgi:hypothetical protein
MTFEIDRANLTNEQKDRMFGHLANELDAPSHLAWKPW